MSDVSRSELIVAALDAYFEATGINCLAAKKPPEGIGSPAEQLLVAALEEYFAGDQYIAGKEGDSGPLHECPECHLNAYVTQYSKHAYFNINECLLCGFELENCGMCEEKLTPDTVSWDDHELCCDCSYRIEKIRSE